MAGHRGINLRYFLTLQSCARVWLLSKVEKSVSFFIYVRISVSHATVPEKHNVFQHNETSHL